MRLYMRLYTKMHVLPTIFTLVNNYDSTCYAYVRVKVFSFIVMPLRRIANDIVINGYC